MYLNLVPTGCCVRRIDRESRVCGDDCEAGALAGRFLAEVDTAGCAAERISGQTRAVDGDVFTADIAALARGRHVDSQPCAADFINIDGCILGQRVDNRVARARAFAHVKLRRVDKSACQRAFRVRFAHRHQADHERKAE
ncbi:hypothetical protein SDC9_141987 [bioreactor metagenome]|uniref:Uncharacterized protein n=1 Tax=bioreactor metagenome TaxID=1076179 RepID=A0A645DZZ5_9ZZZZ